MIPHRSIVHELPLCKQALMGLEESCDLFGMVVEFLELGVDLIGLLVEACLLMTASNLKIFFVLTFINSFVSTFIKLLDFI